MVSCRDIPPEVRPRTGPGAWQADLTAHGDDGDEDDADADDGDADDDGADDDDDDDVDHVCLQPLLGRNPTQSAFGKKP